MAMNYNVLEASKLRFGFSISDLREVTGIFPVTSVSSCQQQQLPYIQLPVPRAFWATSASQQQSLQFLN